MTTTEEALNNDKMEAIIERLNEITEKLNEGTELKVADGREIRVMCLPEGTHTHSKEQHRYRYQINTSSWQSQDVEVLFENAVSVYFNGWVGPSSSGLQLNCISKDVENSIRGIASYLSGSPTSQYQPILAKFWKPVYLDIFQVPSYGCVTDAAEPGRPKKTQEEPITKLWKEHIKLYATGVYTTKHFWKTVLTENSQDFLELDLNQKAPHARTVMCIIVGDLLKKGPEDHTPTSILFEATFIPKNIDMGKILQKVNELRLAVPNRKQIQMRTGVKKTHQGGWTFKDIFIWKRTPQGTWKLIEISEREEAIMVEVDL